MGQEIIVKSFNGIGDMLFATPSFKVIKESYPDCFITVNTNRAEVVRDNPYVDKVGGNNEGVFLGYPAPDGGVHPVKHHILTDWEIICKAYNLKTNLPQVKPEIYYKPKTVKKTRIAVQCEHKRNYHSKRVWPHFDTLADMEGFERIPHFDNKTYLYDLMDYLSGCDLVVCGEGGISHLCAGLNKKALVLFGGFSDPIWTGYSFHMNVTTRTDCHHCFNLSPCKNNFKCWNELSLDTVKTIAESLIR
jgi:ADP-heptose:LPS heptosyltransferase